jgi:hypothetical protein
MSFLGLDHPSFINIWLGQSSFFHTKLSKNDVYIYDIIYICETKVDNFDMTQNKACSFSTPIIRLELQEASTTAHRIATELDTLTWQIENAAHG